MRARICDEARYRTSRLLVARLPQLPMSVRRCRPVIDLQDLFHLYDSPLDTSPYGSGQSMREYVGQPNDLALVTAVEHLERGVVIGQREPLPIRRRQRTVPVLAGLAAPAGGVARVQTAVAAKEARVLPRLSGWTP